MAIEDTIKDLLGVGIKVADIIPGLSDIKPDLEFALNAAPAVENAYKYFQSPKGQRAIKELNTFLAYVQSSDGQEAISHVKAVLAVTQTRA